MGLFNRLRGNRQAIEPPLPESSDPECMHIDVVPQWDSPADLGHEERASRFVCGTCGQVFSPAELESLLAARAERLRQVAAAAPAPGDTGA